MSRLSLAGRVCFTSSAMAISAACGGAALACNPSITLSGPASTGDITNTGSVDCILVSDHATVNGNIVNEPTGTIGSAASRPGTGIAIDNATINGAIVNNGVINATG